MSNPTIVPEIEKIDVFFEGIRCWRIRYSPHIELYYNNHIGRFDWGARESAVHFDRIDDAAKKLLQIRQCTNYIWAVIESVNT